MAQATDGARRDTKAAFFDIDGTLTSFVTHRIPDSTIRSLQALQARGMRIFICTGRTAAHLPVVLDSMPVAFDGIVGANGQYCFDAEGYKKTEAIDVESVGALLDWLDAHPDVVANFGEDSTTYFNHMSPQMEAQWKSLGKTAPKIVIDDPRARYLEHPIYQVSPYVDADQEADLLARVPGVRSVRWHPDFIDLIPADGGKDKGMARMLRHYGWDASQAIAFGDGGNDIDMQRYAGLGVAMGNATDDTKQAADYVTDSVDDDGIRNALVRFGVLDAADVPLD
ncbi:MAG: Cof-type HAD-IIB family hydrolase [Bifidobacterium sp.]|nr:Cof-type HAD-IIB family hydrolase [Bifidobacterium sp.]